MIEIDDNVLNPESFLKSLNDGVYAVDTDRRIVYWGPSAERITGWRAADIMGKRCSDDVLNHVDKDGRPLCGREHCPLHRAMVTGNSSDLPIVVFARQEARLTRRIQSTMLRGRVLKDSRLTFTTHYLPWGMVGGDYYAMEQIDEDRFAFILADVSGHGFAASLYTVYLNALWHTHHDLLSQPSELARAMHAKLATLIGDDGRFATAIFGLIDLKKMCATLTFAGGPTPLLFGSDGKLEILGGTGIPLGMPIDADYEEKTIPVHPGDCLLAFTDGVTEITDVNGKLLEVEGLVQILEKIGYPESRDFKALEEKLLTLSDRIRFNDDLTFLEARLSDEAN